MSSADTISKEAFSALVAKYPSLISTTNQPLDTFRYDEAPRLFARDAMTLSHVQKLVEWKLRHGKFRPTLMNLVSSNDAQTTASTIAAAVAQYRAREPAKLDPKPALGTLTKLRGIGPATASLVLSVHDAPGAIFFSDEAYWWLCCGGRKRPIRYNLREYMDLWESAKRLAGRLDVAVVDVEKAAYVVMRSETDQIKREPPAREQEPKPKKRAGADRDVDETALRRSKRKRNINKS